MNENSYRQQLEQRTRRAFKAGIIIFGAAILLIVLSAVSYQIWYNRPSFIIEHSEIPSDPVIEGHQDVDGTVPLLLKRRDSL